MGWFGPPSRLDSHRSFLLEVSETTDLPSALPDISGYATEPMAQDRLREMGHSAKPGQKIESTVPFRSGLPLHLMAFNHVPESDPTDPALPTDVAPKWPHITLGPDNLGLRLLQLPNVAPDKAEGSLTRSPEAPAIGSQAPFLSLPPEEGRNETEIQTPTHVLIDVLPPTSHAPIVHSLQIAAEVVAVSAPVRPDPDHLTDRPLALLRTEQYRPIAASANTIGTPPADRPNPEADFAKPETPITPVSGTRSAKVILAANELFPLNFADNPPPSPLTNRALDRLSDPKIHSKGMAHTSDTPAQPARQIPTTPIRHSSAIENTLPSPGAIVETGAATSMTSPSSSRPQYLDLSERTHAPTIRLENVGQNTPAPLTVVDGRTLLADRTGRFEMGATSSVVNRDVSERGISKFAPSAVTKDATASIPRQIEIHQPPTHPVLPAKQLTVPESQIRSAEPIQTKSTVSIGSAVDDASEKNALEIPSRGAVHATSASPQPRPEVREKPSQLTRETGLRKGHITIDPIRSSTKTPPVHLQPEFETPSAGVPSTSEATGKTRNRQRIEVPIRPEMPQQSSLPSAPLPPLADIRPQSPLATASPGFPSIPRTGFDALLNPSEVVPDIAQVVGSPMPTIPSMAALAGPVAIAPPSVPFMTVPMQLVQSVQAALGADHPMGAIELTLDPPELGTVRVVVSRGDDGPVVQMIADRPETLDLMRKHAGSMAQEFARQGLDTASFQFGGQRNQNEDHGPSGTIPVDDDPVDPTDQVAGTSSTGTGMDIRI